MKTFKQIIMNDLKRFSWTERSLFIKYCIVSEENKQYDWFTREIRKLHSNNVKFLRSLLSREFWMIF